MKLTKIQYTDNKFSFLFLGEQSIVSYIFRAHLFFPDSSTNEYVELYRLGDDNILYMNYNLEKLINKNAYIAFEIGNRDFYTKLNFEYTQNNSIYFSSDKFASIVCKNSFLQFIIKTQEIYIEKLSSYANSAFIKLVKYVDDINENTENELIYIDIVHRETKEKSTYCPVYVKNICYKTIYLYMIPITSEKNIGKFDLYFSTPFYRNRITNKHIKTINNAYHSINNKFKNYFFKYYYTQDNCISIYIKENTYYTITDIDITSESIDIHAEALAISDTTLSISYRLKSNSNSYINLQHVENFKKNIDELTFYHHTIKINKELLSNLFNKSSFKIEAYLHNGQSIGIVPLRAKNVKIDIFRLFHGMEVYLADKKRALAIPSFDKKGFFQIFLSITDKYELFSIEREHTSLIFKYMFKANVVQAEQLEQQLCLSTTVLRFIFEDGTYYEYSSEPSKEGNNIFIVKTDLDITKLLEKSFYMLLHDSNNVWYQVKTAAPLLNISKRWYLCQNPGEYASWRILDKHTLKKSKQKNRRIKILFNFLRGIAWVMKKISRRPVWLIGEYLSQTSSDNGFAFFNYLRKVNNIEEKFYYIATKENAQKNGLADDRHVCIKDSLHHLWLFALAKKCFVTHSLSDVLPTFLYQSHSINWKDVWYLQHGVVAMKKIGYTPKTYNAHLKKFIVSSEQEKKFLLPQLGNTLLNIGLCRFDTLESEPTEKPFILIMPTWQEWLREGEFTESQFYKAWTKLLSSKAFSNCLQLSNLQAHFVPHKFMRPYFHEFPSFPNVHIIDPEAISKKIRQCTLLITDYSSVAFDVAFQGKPVIFYWYNKDQYFSERGMYIKENDLFGIRAYSSSEIINAINIYKNNSFKATANDNYKIKLLISWNDKQSCSRLYRHAHGGTHEK